MAGITDLIDIYRGETINLNPFRSRASAAMNDFGKALAGKYATTSADEAINYASKKFPNKILKTKITPQEFKIGKRVFNEIEPDYSEGKEGKTKIKRIANKVKNFTRNNLSDELNYNILSSKNKNLLKTDILKTIASNTKALTPLAMKGLTFLSSLPVATITMFLQSTPANSDEINMKLEDFAMLANKEKEGIETIDIGEDND